MRERAKRLLLFWMPRWHIRQTSYSFKSVPTASAKNLLRRSIKKKVKDPEAYKELGFQFALIEVAKSVGIAETRKRVDEKYDFHIRSQHAKIMNEEHTDLRPYHAMLTKPYRFRLSSHIQELLADPVIGPCELALLHRVFLNRPKFEDVANQIHFMRLSRCSHYVCRFHTMENAEMEKIGMYPDLDVFESYPIITEYYKKNLANNNPRFWNSIMPYYGMPPEEDEVHDDKEEVVQPHTEHQKKRSRGFLGCGPLGHR